jgi:hypothetical protein
MWFLVFHLHVFSSRSEFITDACRLEVTVQFGFWKKTMQELLKQNSTSVCTFRHLNVKLEEMRKQCRCSRRVMMSRLYKLELVIGANERKHAQFEDRYKLNREPAAVHEPLVDKYWFTLPACRYERQTPDTGGALCNTKHYIRVFTQVTLREMYKVIQKFLCTCKNTYFSWWTYRYSATQVVEGR